MTKLVAGFGFQENNGGRPKGNDQIGDCAVRAIAIASGVPYAKIIDMLGGTYDEGGTMTIGVGDCLRRLGWTHIQVDDYSDDDHSKSFDQLGLDMNATYVVNFTNRHTAAVVKGVVNDTWDSRYFGQRGNAVNRPAEISGYFRKWVPTDDRDYDELLAGFTWCKTSRGYAWGKTKVGHHDEAVEAIQIGFCIMYPEAAELVMAKNKEFGIKNPHNYMHGTSREVWTSILEDHGWQFTKIGKRGKNLASIDFKKNPHNNRMIVETYDRVIAVKGRTWFDRFDSRRNSHDGFSATASIDDFRDTSNPTKRPKTVVVKGYWLPPICHCFSDAESNCING